MAQHRMVVQIRRCALLPAVTATRQLTSLYQPDQNSLSDAPGGYHYDKDWVWTETCSAGAEPGAACRPSTWNIFEKCTASTAKTG